MKRLQITLTKSPIGAKPVHRKTVRALGLRKMHQTVVKNDTDAIRGMVRAVAHLVDCQEIT